MTCLDAVGPLLARLFRLGLAATESLSAFCDDGTKKRKSLPRLCTKLRWILGKDHPPAGYCTLRGVFVSGVCSGSTLPESGKLSWLPLLPNSITSCISWWCLSHSSSLQGHSPYADFCSTPSVLVTLSCRAKQPPAQAHTITCRISTTTTRIKHRGRTRVTNYTLEVCFERKTLTQELRGKMR